MKIWKLLSALLVHGVLFVTIPYVLSNLDLITRLNLKAYVVLAVTWIGLGLKLLFGDVISDKFEYHKHGYDFCVLTMGTALSMLSLQVMSDTEVLHGIPTTGPWADLCLISADAAKQQLALLAGLFLLTCFMALVTARISRAVGEPATKGKNVLSLFNFAIGASVFASYLFLLLAKE